MNRKDKILSTLNPMQKEAVLKTEGPLLVLAGAGSGKTRVLTHRIAYLMEELGVRAFNILAITFTNKAAREMKERVTAITEDGRLVWVSTFHSTCVRILRREIERLGYTQNFTIYDSEDSQRIIKEVLNELHLDVRKFPPKAVLSAIGSLKDELITPYAAMDMAADYTERKNAEIYNCYQNKLKSYNALDFDDLIFKTVELFSKQPEVLEKYQDRFIYIMVDEYQDTNTAQYTLIRLLSSKYGNLCVVGDDDQSIYGWRGANIRNILEFEKDFENTVVIKLEQNYRSTKVILDAANSVIKNNYGRKAKKLWTENDSGEKVSFHRLNSDIEEAGFICEEIMKMTGSKKAEYKDFAILYRNNALSRVLEERFVRASVPYRLYGSVNFYGRKEIKDVMAYLKAVFNPDDENAIKRIINVPKRGIGESTADKVSVYAAANEISFFDVLSNINKIPEFKTRAKRLNAFYELLCEFSQLADNLRPSELIEAVLKKTEYIGELRAEGTEEALGRIENVMELVSKAVEYEQDNPEDCSLAGFLNEISLVADTDNTKEDENRVVLMTLHSSKGLEFNYVFLAGFEDGIFPSRRVDFSSDINAVEEERRLCYVGITRAKKQLYITCAKSRLQYGNIDYNMPSRFLKEIPREFIDGLENETKIDIDSEEEDTDIAYKPKLEYIVVRPQRGIERREFPAPKDIKLDFEVGDTVRQMKYGKGVVKKISPAGADYEVTVDFEMAGEKKIMAVLSKLRRV